MSAYEDLIVSVADGIARITVNRPNRLNALRNETGDELQAALRVIEADPSVRVLVLTGAGRGFGAGYDLGTVRPDETLELEVVLEKHFNPVVRSMRHSRLPIITQINGPCAGASVGLALAGDIIMAAKSAFFYEPFVGIALVPDAGNTLFLPRLMGRVRAAPMMMLGDRISAEEAQSWGLVWKVFEDDALEIEVNKIATKLASLAPDALAATKQLITAAADTGLDESLDLERDLQGIAGRSPEMKAAVAAFFAKRK
ncbi:2-(1,2-epoxy-1,2-dihydrophenyl)acetyl-CoA isomerase [Rhodoligotrophos appendicifer]|uniref:enoyl-CoA hydratase-related protein n=1 Tax=Rhodoligotrophos appendicifer TaxID=987056 RepID=UPI001186B923|nr:enoyl-CoA hydratase-related protein [Rhodoligotrophos appendicifer]